MYKIKEIKIPITTEIPTDFDSFSLEENASLLIAGYQYIKAVKNGVFENPCLKERIKEIFEKDLEKKEEKIKELGLLNEHTKQFYYEMLGREKEAIKKEILDSHSKELEYLRKILEEERVKSKEIELEKVRLEEKANYSMENGIANRIKDAEMRFLIEKEEMNQRISQLSLEKAKITEEFQEYRIGILEKDKRNTVAKQRGNNGEEILYELLQRTFSSLNCEIENTAGASHKGDFHLKFERFTVLVDCKNYIDSKQVNVESRKQIKHDLEQNRHIKIAWLISLNKPISKYGGVPWQFDIEDGICCFYINELLMHHSPEETLKMIWKSSCNLYTILDMNAETSELTRLKEYENRVKQIYERLNTLSKQRHLILNQSLENLNKMKANFADTDKADIELINHYIMNMNEVHAETIKSWWNANIVKKEGSKMKTDQIYSKFLENPENQRIEKEVFRDILCSLVKDDEILKGKQAKTQYTIVNYTWTS
jgi:hypothetical protein